VFTTIIFAHCKIKLLQIVSDYQFVKQYVKAVVRLLHFGFVETFTGSLHRYTLRYSTVVLYA